MSSAYDTERYERAAKRLLEDPKSLTDEDIEQFEVVSPQFAESARAKRAGFELPGRDFSGEEFSRTATVGLVMRLLWHADDHQAPYRLSWLWRVRDNQKRIAALEQEVSSLKQQVADAKRMQRGLAYIGVWDSKTTYAQGDSVTWDGGLFVAKVDNVARVPNQQPDCWQLAVRRGAEGKQGPAGRCICQP